MYIMRIYYIDLKMLAMKSLGLGVMIFYSEKTTDLPQVTGKLYHIMLYQAHNFSGDRH